MGSGDQPIGRARATSELSLDATSRTPGAIRLEVLGHIRGVSFVCYATRASSSGNEERR